MENCDDKEKLDETKALINIKVSDIFGLSKSAVEVRKISENILKSLEKGIGKLADPALTLIQAKADANATAIKGDAELEFSLKKMDLYSTYLRLIKEAGGSHELTGLAKRSFSREMVDALERQNIREKVSHYLFDELQYIPLSEPPNNSIDTDWLTMFWDTVEKKSAVDFQRIYAKILAGECLSPGSFSSRLLHILSVMTQKDAKAFETVCSMSIKDVDGVYLLEPLIEYDSFLQEAITNTNEMGDFVIEDLESLGLLGRSSIIAFQEEEDGTEKEIGGTTCKVIVSNADLLSENKDHVAGIPFTQPAEELRSIISLETNLTYFDTLNYFLDKYLGIEFKSISEV